MESREPGDVRYSFVVQFKVGKDSMKDIKMARGQSHTKEPW